MGIGQFVVQLHIRLTYIRITKSVVTRRIFQESTRSKCVGGRDFTPDPAGIGYGASLHHLAGLKGRVNDGRGWEKEGRSNNFSVTNYYYFFVDR